LGEASSLDRLVSYGPRVVLVLLSSGWLRRNRMCIMNSKEFYWKLFLLVAALVLFGMVLVLLRTS
jgi:hypothetical protein